MIAEIMLKSVSFNVAHESPESLTCDLKDNTTSQLALDHLFNPRVQIIQLALGQDRLFRLAQLDLRRL